MYFGSVKFFKHLILTIVFGWIIIATGLAAFFGIKYYLTTKNLDIEDGTSYENAMVIPSNATLEQLYLILCAKGYTPDDLLNFLAKNENDSVSRFMDNYNPEDFQAENADFDIIDDNADTSEEPSPNDNNNNDNNNIETDNLNLPSYTKLYPELYADATFDFVAPEKIIYLTFDDGPSKNTLDILDILEKYDIKATFFMSGGTDDYSASLMRKVAKEGHTLAVHSMSHKYDEVYQSVETFLEDFNNTYMSIYEATGVRPQLYRFPGGSVNNHNKAIAAEIIAEVTRRGFVYHDWNISGEDATSSATWTSIYENVVYGVENMSAKRAIVLLHDSADKVTTVHTLEDIIDSLLADGYAFEALDSTIQPFTFHLTE